MKGISFFALKMVISAQYFSIIRAPWTAALSDDVKSTKNRTYKTVIDYMTV